MKFLRQGTNPHTGIRYRLLFDSVDWEWFIQAKDDSEPGWINTCWFWDLDEAEAHLVWLLTQKGKRPGILNREEI